MKNRTLFWLWGAAFVLCAGLALAELSRGVWTAVSVLFFLPPAVLTYRARRGKDENLRLLLRNLSGASLGLTLLGIVVGILTAPTPAQVGTMVHRFLTVVSTPMMLSGYWALSLFLWACLFVSTVKKPK